MDRLSQDLSTKSKILLFKVHGGAQSSHSSHTLLLQAHKLSASDSLVPED